MMKKTRYTRKQIEESIKYWKKQLNEDYSEDASRAEESDVDSILDEFSVTDRSIILKALIDMMLVPKNYRVLKEMLNRASTYNDSIAIFAKTIKPYARKREELANNYL